MKNTATINTRTHLGYPPIMLNGVQVGEVWKDDGLTLPGYKGTVWRYNLYGFVTRGYSPTLKAIREEATRTVWSPRIGGMGTW